MAASVLTSYAMPLQMIFLEAMDVDVVRANPRTQGLHYSTQRNHTLTFAGFLQVLKHYRICPDLLSRAQVLTLFKSLGMHHPSKMEMHDFMSALAKCAILVFSSEEWDRNYPTEEQKMRLLLLWMDKNSRLFKGNGRKLCKSVEGAPAQASLSPAPHSLDRWLTLPHIEQLDTILQAAFGYYCAGDSDAITSMSFLRFLRDVGLRDGVNLRLADIDVIFHQIRGMHRAAPLPQTLCYEEFYAALGMVSSRLYTTTGSSNRCFLLFMNEYILPALAHMHHMHLPLHNYHDSWRERWQQLCTLKQILASSATKEIFDSRPTYDLSAKRYAHHLPGNVHEKDEVQPTDSTAINPGSLPPSPSKIHPITQIPTPRLDRVDSVIHLSQSDQVAQPHDLSTSNALPSQEQALELQVLEELQQLSLHLRQKLRCHPAPVCVNDMGKCFPPPPSSVRLKTALDRLAQELSASTRSSPAQDLDTTPAMPRRAKQRQPHTLRG
ncbi:hypothetical protein H310_07395 [Aphanomyces invadans]|uniref:EF-hand domain-containing protein n=1 Tax=Aphanomyces invadans TaxID=157072 RepID=A0A024U3T4_9STRA|nr:hypothetical protein H310_07395 [Aphanomyces invadans]ETW00875.1 hypothetical protein H310_07395 [Aphanomyces invadans]|eukprot:XP_008871010.1 hypothetical protein H310_07395 [Aphanomyces invadans]